MNRIWEYALVGESVFYSLSESGATITDICNYCKVTYAVATGNLFEWCYTLTIITFDVNAGCERTVASVPRPLATQKCINMQNDDVVVRKRFHSVYLYNKMNIYAIC